MSTKRDEPSPALLGAWRAGPRSLGDTAPIDAPLVGDLYRSWRVAELQCGAALRAWLDAGPADGGARYAAYRAGLDREEAAARHLQRVWEQPQSDTSNSIAE